MELAAFGADLLQRRSAPGILRAEDEFKRSKQGMVGSWRPIIGTVVGKFLECGDLRHGFARVRCPKCREDFFMPLYT